MKTQLTHTHQSILSRSLTTLAAVSILATPLSLRAAGDGYVAHEWGTFTSIQGSDGVLLDWNGIATSDLPEFVYNWSRPGLQRFDPTILTKAWSSSLQRMETPVIYFYPDKPMNVDVVVEFPKGKITEWYPQARDIGPSTRPPNPLLTALDNAVNRLGARPNPSFIERFGESPITNSVIHWSQVELVPARQKPELARQFPISNKASHYFAARETDAGFVRVAPMEKSVTAPEVDRFLFYRGIGNFQAPLKVTINEQEQLTVANTGSALLKHLFALKVQGDRAAFVPLGDLAASNSRETRVEFARNSKPLTDVVAQLSRQMADALESEGLYRAEAEAMVKTWRDAWFEDEGLRILYVLPRAWTDQILPITLEPKPRELVRVMVGRSELITPAVESQVRELVTRFRESDPSVKQATVRQFQSLKLGRFAAVAVRRVALQTKDQDFYKDGAALIQAAELQKAAPTVSSL